MSFSYQLQLLDLKDMEENLEELLSRCRQIRQGSGDDQDTEVRHQTASADQESDSDDTYWS
ncbi:MAG: hypothetical protein RID53_33620 [Coleofasciculus sp. B1-GNL1-01]|uniref:hypothetical protein n=1 Tax=Coleofasciculus sp. B1-GNL1-01 TaxID=3068484 RepID=UPI0032F456FE